MFILKLLAKIALLPVVLLLGIALGIVKMITMIYGFLHGFVVFFLGILCVATVLVHHDWLQASLVALLGGISFVIFAAGIFLDALIQNSIRNICEFIAG
ncbi:MAG: hypothetical protein Q4B26_17540 [Eubacteriales bacterium]|nr:hypothetical protein [Eubacteriales bacterium]